MNRRNDKMPHQQVTMRLIALFLLGLGFALACLVFPAESTDLSFSAATLDLLQVLPSAAIGVVTLYLFAMLWGE